MLDTFPPPEELVKLEPEEIAIFLLELLQSSPDNNQTTNRYNLTLQSTLQPNYAGDLYEEVAKVITEAWNWLQIEGLIAPKPSSTSGDFVFVTRRGMALNSRADLNSYTHSKLLPDRMLDPILARKVKPLFMRGDYDTAVFQAYKEVEIRVRDASGLPNSDMGTALMRNAFRPENGPLTDMNALLAEREAIAHLFAGAIGIFKNPSSHRDVDYQAPAEVAKIIMTADMLLKIVEKATPQ